MVAHSDSYSRLIAWLKILLPLAALAILSTLFLVSRSLDPTLTLPFADEKIQDLAREPKIGNPSFSGVTANGSALSLSATALLPLQGGQPGVRATGLTGVFETADGQKLNFSAQSGSIDNTARLANLGEGVLLVTSSGYRIETDGIIADLNTSSVSTQGPISASGPLGEITAGRVIYRQKEDTADGAYELVFQNGVKLVYSPRQQ